jgi:hypothetical protein
MNMFLLGLFAGIGFFVVFLLCLYIGYRIGKKPTAKVEKLEPREIQLQKQLKKEFDSLMSYDVDQALQRKKVE